VVCSTLDILTRSLTIARNTRIHRLYFTTLAFRRLGNFFIDLSLALSCAHKRTIAPSLPFPRGLSRTPAPLYHPSETPRRSKPLFPHSSPPRLPHYLGNASGLQPPLPHSAGPPNAGQAPSKPYIFEIFVGTWPWRTAHQRASEQL
jgi:hypothetical protein